MLQPETDLSIDPSVGHQAALAAADGPAADGWGMAELCSAMDSVGTPIWALDLQGRCVFINESARERFGYSREEALGRKLNCLIHKGASSGWACAKEDCPCQRCIETGSSTTGREDTFLKVDGTPVSVEFSVRPIVVEGRIRGCVISALDIAPRKRAEAALEDFFSKAPLPMAVWDLEGRIVRSNAAFLGLTGYSIGDLEGSRIFDFVHPDQRTEARTAFQELLGVREKAVFECRVRRKDGSYRWLILSAAIARGARAIYVGAHDITKVMEAEEAARKSEEWLRFTLDTAGAGLCYRESGETAATEQQFRLYGLEPSEDWISRAHWLQLIHPEDRERVETEQRLAAKLDKPYDIQFRVVWPDGSVHWLLSRGKTFHRGRDIRKTEITVDVTDLNRAERTLEQAFTVTESAIGILDFDGHLKRANPALVRTSGFTLEELSQRAGLELFHPDDRATIKAEFDKLIAGGRVAQLECRGLRKDGSYVWLLLRASVLADEKLIYTVSTDITERKRAADALAEEAHRRRILFEQSRDGIVVFDGSGKVREANQSFANMLGYDSPEAVLQLHVWDWDEQLTPDLLRSIVQDVKSHQPQPGAMEVRHKRKDGSLIDVEISPTTVELGGEILFYAVHRDITERKGAEKALRQSEQRLRLIAETIDDVFWMADLTSDSLAYVSPACERVWGQPLEVVRKSFMAFLDAVHPDDRAQLRAAVGACMKDPKPFKHEYRVIRPDGTVAWVCDHGFPVGDGNGHVNYVVGLARDVTHRKSMEEAVRIHSEKLARSNAELERFAYVASHDLQEPLRMVASFTQLLAKRYSGRLDETADRYIHYAVDGAKRMQELIVDLLAYSRVNSKELDFKTTPCEAVVAGVLQNLQAAIDESNASVKWDPLPTLLADPGQLRQLFQNLLGNAIKFRGESPPQVHISAVEEGESWVFSVRDNGIGLDPDQSDRIFQVFQRLHGRTEYPGTGIGLAICKKVVERHGGKIWVESRPGAGSTFRFTLPISLLHLEHGGGNETAEHASGDPVG